MFGKQYETGNRVLCIYVAITCEGEKKFRVWAEDLGKKNSKYADREIIVKGKRTIFLSFPISPKNIFIGVLNANDVKDTAFEVQLIEAPIMDYNIHLDAETERFLQLCLHFCQVSGFEQGTPQGRMFQTSNNEFNIRYFDTIRDIKSGKEMNTPARIGHRTGVIDVAKVRFDNYTIPMRIMIMLHEFSHKYKNPKIGLEISDEIGADINALYIYLGLGFSKIDAICVFAQVFLKAQTKGNIERMRKIMDYIRRFENQEYAKKN